jgi:hypothetical protein
MDKPVERQVGEIICAPRRKERWRLEGSEQQTQAGRAARLLPRLATTYQATLRGQRFGVRDNCDRRGNNTIRGGNRTQFGRCKGIFGSNARIGLAGSDVSEVPHQGSNGTYPVRCRSLRIKELPMANNKNPNEKQPGEKKPGKHHYNPGNMSGKTADLFKEDAEKQNNLDTVESREPPPHERENR